MKKIIICMMLLMLSAVSQTVCGQETVQYWHHDWNEISKRVNNYSSLCSNYKVLDSSTSLSASGDFGVGNNPDWDNGNYEWVVVRGDVVISRLIVLGEGHLILTDGSRLVCTGGVLLQGDNSLNIYSQSSGEHEGRLEINISQPEYKGNAAIGCSKNYELNDAPDGMGTLVIHGGNITATASSYGAGIGGGRNRGIRPSGSVTIWAGKVTATGGEHAAGIGGGRGAGQGGPVSIYGGKVTVTGGNAGAGIGGGRYAGGGSDGGTVTIYNGDITVNAGDGGAGIGGGGYSPGSGSHGGTFTMWDGKLQIKTTDEAAGIGTTIFHFGADLMLHQGGTIRIHGGEITTTGDGWGFGGPDSDIEISGGTIDLTAGYGPGINVGGGKLNITGGNITARGADDAAGIASYYSPTQGNQTSIQCFMNISNATVKATGGKNAPGIGGSTGVHVPTTLLINSGHVTAIGGENAPGIGGALYLPGQSGGSVLGSGKNRNRTDEGGGQGIDVVINGGTVISKGDDESYAMGAYPDFRYNWRNKMGTVNIGDNMKVGYGATIDGDFTDVSAAERNSACHNKQCVKVEECDHSGASTYTYKDELSHIKRCVACGHEKDEAHSYGEGNTEDCVCGKKFNEAADTWTVMLYEATSNKATAYGEATTYKVVKGQKFVIPENTDMSGLTFMGWLQNPATTPADCEMRDEEFTSLADRGEEFTPEANVLLYARYRCQYDDEWTWEKTDDGMTAKVTVTWRNGDTPTEDLNADYIGNESEEPTAEKEGKYSYYATAKLKKDNGVEYQFTDRFSYPYVSSLTLSDNSANSSLIADNADKLVKTVTLSGRTLYTDNSWNTLCLPFDVADTDETDNISFTGTPLEGAIVKTLESSSFNNTTGTLTLDFADADYIEAGQSYIVKWATGTGIASPTFTDAYISSSKAGGSLPSEGWVTFAGSYDPQTLEADDHTVLYLGASNMLYWPAKTMEVGSFRALFYLNDLVAGDISSAASVREFILNLDDEPNAIEEMKVGTTCATGWYTLDGRRLHDKPSVRGIYLNNGRKVLIK